METRGQRRHDTGDRGVSAARDRHHTPEGLARLSELGKAAIADPYRVAAMRAAKAAKNPWPGRVEALRQMTEDGWSIGRMARYFECSRSTICYNCVLHGISATAVRNARMEAGAEVLKRIYHLPITMAEKMAEYVKARGPVSADAMRQHAQRLRLQATRARTRAKPRTMPPKATANLIALRAEERAAMAPAMQARLNDGASYNALMRETGISWKRLRGMVREGLLVKPPRVKVPRKRIRAKAASKPRAPRPVVYAAPKPVKPPIVYQTVEAWLAAGNQVTRCPTAMAAYSPHIDLPEADRAEMVAIHAAREAEAKNQKPGDAVRRIMTLRAKVATQSARMRV